MRSPDIFRIFAFLETIKPFDMGLLNFILMTIPQAVEFTTVPKEVVFHSCPTVTPLGNVIAICITVVVCLSIVAFTVWRCIKTIQNSRKEEIESRVKAEKEKLSVEQTAQENKNRLDSAWRCLNDYYKKKEAEVTDAEKQMAKASMNYLNRMFGNSQMSKPDESKQDKKG